jgi:hypothetical protein
MLCGIFLNRMTWLFCNGNRSSWIAAIHFHLLVSCNRHSLEQFIYLRDLHSVKLLSEVVPII